MTMTRVFDAMAKAKNPLAFVWEPIDWSALAAHYRDVSRRTRKGDKRPREEVERQKAARRENIRRRQREATERRYAATRKRIRGRWRFEAALQAMAPGCWYGSVDVGHAIGLKTREAFTTLLRLEACGLVERAQNPEWAEHVYRKGIGIHRQARREPKWLWGLTGAGEARRNALVASAGREGLASADGSGARKSEAGAGPASGDVAGAYSAARGS